MALGSSWNTTTRAGDPMRESLVARAKQRTVTPGKGVYLIAGKESLGDKYPEYEVRKLGDGTWVCSCMGHGGGQYRKTCSHITGVLLYEKEHGKMEERGGEGEEEEEEREEKIDDEWGWKPSPSLASQPIESPPSPSTPAPDLLSSTPLPSEISLPSEPPLPAKFETFRDPQWKAIVEIVQAFDDGYKVVFVSAPTGAGKTLIAESVRRLMGVKAIYTCTTKTLQDQVLRDFGEYARVLKGRSNYRTLDNPRNPNLTAAECVRERVPTPACPGCPGWSKGGTWGAGTDVGGELGDDEHHLSPMEQMHCVWCHPWSRCPYQVAKMEAVGSRLAILNTSYLLSETQGKKSMFRGWPLVLIDEADKLEDELMRFVEVSFGPKTRKMLGVGLPQRKTVDEEWVRWVAEEVIPAIGRKRQGLGMSTALPGLEDADRIRHLNQLDTLLKDANRIITRELDPETGEFRPVLQQGWVYTGYEKKDERYATVTFKPLMVRDFARDLLWSQNQQFMLLSATLISPEQMAFELGLEDDEWTVVEVPSSFPVKRRPIVPEMKVAVTHKTKDDTYPILAAQISDILERHEGDRVLIHSVSYDLTQYLYKRLKDNGDGRRLETYLNSGERQDALSRFLEKDDGVLIAPSFDRGVDLHGDDCRVIIVTKIPYPYLGDKQVSQRLYATGKTGRIWYAVQTIRTICQMTGRGMRSEDDACITYILDAQFRKLYSENRRLFPGWWADAIVWDVNDPQWKDAYGLNGSRG